MPTETFGSHVRCTDFAKAWERLMLRASSMCCPSTRSATTALFAKHTVTSATPCLACRFFSRRADFDEETAFYRDPVLAKLLPSILDASDNANGRTRSRGGYIFPPYLVLERGITLAMWAESKQGFFGVRAFALQDFLICGFEATQCMLAKSSFEV